MRPGGRKALGFTAVSGQRREGLTETHIAASFTDAQILEKDKDFCALAITTVTSLSCSATSSSPRFPHERIPCTHALRPYIRERIYAGV